MHSALKKRHTNHIHLNTNSSRSHAIFKVHLFDKNENQVSTFTFVDLAGSEK